MKVSLNTICHLCLNMLSEKKPGKYLSVLFLWSSSVSFITLNFIELLESTMLQILQFLLFSYTSYLNLGPLIII